MSITYHCRECGKELIRISWVDDQEPEGFEVKCSCKEENNDK